LKIALAQVESITGDIEANIARHLAALGRLRAGDADLVIFPELSLCNYEPAAAGRAAIDPGDARLAPFEAFASKRQMTVCVGAALGTAAKPSIAALLFPPRRSRRVVHKAYLHDDEAAFFAAGCAQASLLEKAPRVALAICHDLSVDAHIEQAASRGMEVYVASVAKTAAGIAAARERLRAKAREYGVPVLVVNSTGTCEGKRAGGHSMAIDARGELLRALGAGEQAILIHDLEHSGTKVLPLDVPARG
jgi:predicted amidohydrolase